MKSAKPDHTAKIIKHCIAASFWRFACRFWIFLALRVWKRCHVHSAVCHANAMPLKIQSWEHNFWLGLEERPSSVHYCIHYYSKAWQYIQKQVWSSWAFRLRFVFGRKQCYIWKLQTSQE